MDFYNFIYEIIVKANKNDCVSLNSQYETKSIFKKIYNDALICLSQTTCTFEGENIKMKNLLNFHQYCFKALLELIKSENSLYFALLNSMNQSLIHNFYSSGKKLSQVKETIKEFEARENLLKAETIQRTSELISNVEKLMRENNELKTRFAKEKQWWDNEKNEYELQIKNLAKENKEVFNKLINDSKIQPSKDVVNKSSRTGSNFIQKENILNDKLNDWSLQRSKSLKQELVELKIPTQDPSMRMENFQTLGGKEFTLQQTKDLANEILINKEDYDKKCEHMKIRYETLESFVTIYLNSKFGLKNIVEDWRLGFKQGVNKFHMEEIDILLFKRVLENEVDEDYVIIHNELKKTIGDSLKVILKVFY